MAGSQVIDDHSSTLPARNTATLAPISALSAGDSGPGPNVIVDEPKREG